MDFLLECIGFPPDLSEEELVDRALREGESVPYRGDAGCNLRLPLGHGLELRLDREPGGAWTILPFYASPHRLRIAVDGVQRFLDSPYDALVSGWAAPPVPELEDEDPDRPGAYHISFWLVDALRLPRRLEVGHVLAVSIAGFALDVDYVGRNDGARDPRILERERGAWLRPLVREDEPGGCDEVSLRIRELRHLRNAMTGHEVRLLEADAPERPLPLFLSPWQLEQVGLPDARPGSRVEGTFLFTGRVAGGLPPGRRKREVEFG